MRRFSLFLFSLALVSLTAASSSAQVRLGQPPFGSHGGGPDVINLANLNAHWTVPIISKPGRGVDFTYSLGYDTSVWTPVGVSGSQAWQPLGGWGWVAQSPLVGGSVTYALVNSFSLPCNPPYDLHQVTYYEYGNWAVTDMFGTSHSFSTDVWSTSGCPYQQPQPTSATQVATDGSGWTLQASGAPGGSVWDTRGNVITNAFTDRNGNQVTVSGNTYTDTLGSTVLTLGGSISSGQTYTYTAPSGAAATYTVKYTTYSIRTNFACSGITEYGANGTTTASLVSEIDLPDYNVSTNPNSRYTFSYEATPGHSGFKTGRLASVTLPTGGMISYAYSGGGTGVNGITCADGSAATLTRTTPDGTWTYAQVKGTGAASTTTITDPSAAANQTVIQFQGIYETQRQVYQGSASGTPLVTINTCYNGAVSPCNGTAITQQITQRIVITTLPNNLQSKHNDYFNAYGVPTETDDYDYGSGAPGALLKKTLVTYASLQNITAFHQTVTVCNGIGTSSNCLGPSGSSAGTVVAETNYNYDETGVITTSGTPQHVSVSGSRGNLTSINYPAGGLKSKSTYFDTGNLQTATDVNNAQTTFTYGACGNSFPTSVSEPLSLARSMTWKCTGGVLLTSTDENNQTTTATYNDAYFWRENAVTDQASNTTNIAYPLGGTTVTPSLFFNNNNSLVAVAHNSDGLGRPSFDQGYQSPTAQTWDTVSYTYDANGRSYSTSVPCSVGAGSNCPSGTPKTTQTYDALNRPLQTTDGGGGTVTYTYTNNDVLVTIGPAPFGENTKQHQMEYDALGRLTSVCEITSGTTAWPGASCAQNTSATGYLTKYTYDALGNLLTVTQNAQAGSNQQTRSYTFDAMSRLTSETNPESGTTNYSYDLIPSGCSNAGTYNSGDMTKRVDAAGHFVCPLHDALHRVTDVGSDTGCKRFRYDNTNGVLGAKPSGVTVSNVLGRFAEAETDTCAWPITQSSITTDEWFSYTSRGETSDVYEMTPHSSPSYFHVAQTYWPHGAPSQLSATFNGSAITGFPTISYGGTIGSTVGLDGEGRITQVTASGTGAQNPVTGVTYNNASLPTQVIFGSGDNDIFAYDSNTLRMTQFKFNVGTQPQYLNGALTWNPNSTLNQLVITDQFNSSDTQTCNYSHDDLTRIAQVDCGAGGWGQGFGYSSGQNAGYDPFGNLTKYTLSNRTGYTFQPTYNVVTNRFSSIPGCSSLSYDSNGNVLNDCNHTYTWDADGNSITIDSIPVTFDAFDRMVETNMSGSYNQYLYAPSSGAKLAMMNGSSLGRAWIRLPGGAQAVYTNTGLLKYRHADWLGSTRVTSSPSQTFLSSVAYAPFGETYAGTSGAPVSFTGMEAATTTGDYDFLYREYSYQGRWASPDPAGLAAVDATNPQSWNRYAYVTNNPMNLIDPSGLNDCAPGEWWECAGDDLGFLLGYGNFWNGRGYVGIGGGSSNGTVTITSFLPAWAIETVNTDTETDIDGSFGSADFMNYVLLVPPTGSGNSSWWGAFFSNLFSWQNAKQAQIDAWNKGYYKCLAKKTAGGATAPLVTHAAGVAATNAAESGASTIAGAYYHFTDGRFTAWGKYSEVLVPNLAPKIATAAKVLDVAGWAYFDYELANAIRECSDVLR